MRDIFASAIRADSLQQRLQAVADSGALAMWEVDLRSGALTWSAPGEHILGVPDGQEAKSLNELLSFIHPEDRGRMQSIIGESLSKHALHRHEQFRVIRTDGTVRWVSGHVNFVYDAEGKPSRMIGVAIDITEMSAYEQRLRDTEERLRYAYDAAKVWTCRLDLQDWTITRPLQLLNSASPQYGEAQPFDDWLEHIHPDDRERVRTGMLGAIERAELWEDEFRLRWPDGTYHWIYDRGRKVQAGQQPAFFAGAAMDIDDRKRVEHKLLENEERLRSAYVAGKMWPWEIDLGSHTLRRSDDLGLYLGPARDNSITVAAWIEDIHPEDREKVRKAVQLSSEQNLPYSCEYRLRWTDGRYHWISSRGGVIDDARGQRKLMGIARDFSEEKEIARALEQSERLRLLALDAAELGVFSQDMRTGEIQWSDRQFEIYGISREDFEGKRDAFRRLIVPEDLQRVIDQQAQLIAAQARRFKFDFRIVRPRDGEMRWITSVGEYVYDEAGTLTTMMGVNYDITEQRLHEQELRESEKLRSIAIGAAAMGVWQQDLVTGAIKWTERQFELFDVAPSEFDGTTATAFKNIHPDDRERLQRECNDLIVAHGTRHTTEFRILTRDGGVRWLAAVGEIAYNEAGNGYQSIGVNFDVTVRKEQEQALSESERLRRLALSAAQMGAFEWNTVTGDIRWSPEQYNLLKFDPATCVPTLELFESRVHPDDLQRMQLLMQLLVEKQEKRYRNEFRIVWPDGTVRWVRSLGEFVYDQNGQVTAMFGVNWDVTDQKETEQRIVDLNRELKQKVLDFEALMHAMPVAVAVGLDADNKDVRVNPTFAQLLGLADPDQNIASSSGAPNAFQVTKDGRDVPFHDLPQHRAARTKKEVRNEEFELTTLDGRRLDMFGHAVPLLDETGNVRGTLAAYFDITERKKAEHALRVGEKLATAGKMAASLAHEINNPLAAVTNLLYLVGQDESLSESSKRFVSLATSEISRVSQITRNILAFYRESNQPVEIRLGELVAGVLELYGPKIRHSRIHLDFEREDTCKVLAFPGELRQVISNLIVNAVDAMPDGGELKIRLHSGREWSSNRTGVRLVVSDSGVGIPVEQYKHLFEPFFTTKGEKGTGLGLWVSRDIINKHDGRISVRTSSANGRSGTTFAIFLPSESNSVRTRAGNKVNSVAQS